MTDPEKTRYLTVVMLFNYDFFGLGGGGISVAAVMLLLVSLLQRVTFEKPARPGGK